jgi:hypothetical protein
VSFSEAAIQYVTHALPSSLSSMHNCKNHQKISHKREGMQFFSKQTNPAVFKSPILQGEKH